MSGNHLDSDMGVLRVMVSPENKRMFSVSGIMIYNTKEVFNLTDFYWDKLAPDTLKNIRFGVYFLAFFDHFKVEVRPC